MKTVTVHASRSYEIRMESGLLAAAGEMIRALGSVRRVMVVTDDTVAALYGGALTASLTAAGLGAETFVIPHGEASKNMTTLIGLLNTLAEHRFTRSDVICALGGGVVGDLAGFAAAVYLRGVRYVGIPTTVLACVDSSVGGKTAVDLDAGKNLAGTFWQPSLVLIDPALLDTLPAEIRADGFAEIIKYGVIGDAALFAMLREPSPDITEIIARCVAQKARIVEEDENDRGIRKTLNFGHTAGHAVELNSRFTILHGHGVAIGMMIAARYAAGRGICPAETVAELESMLLRYGLPTASPFGAEALYEAATRDKKREGDGIDVILPTGIGSCVIRRMPIGELADFLREGCR